MGFRPTSLLGNMEGFVVCAIITATIIGPVVSVHRFEQVSKDEFNVFVDELLIISHRKTSPFILVGNSDYSYISKYGNFRVTDVLQEKVRLDRFSVQQDSGSTSLDLSSCDLQVTVRIFDQNDLTYINVTHVPEEINRLWFRLTSTGSDEHVYGGGEQFSYFDLNGRNFPLWLQEQGVGRNKSYGITLLADQDIPASGGDYYSTYWVQPTFVSSRKYFAHFTSTRNGQLDFRNEHFHEVEIWGGPDSKVFPGMIIIGTALTFPDILTKLTGLLGRQPLLPEWMHNGVILGVQGGTEAMLDYLERAQDEGIRVAGLWIQDWVGRITTSFGRRLFWNWEWDPKQYPNLDTEIIRLKEDKDIRLFAYISANLNCEGGLFVEAEVNSYLVTNTFGNTYLVDYGEFVCGIVDLTSPEAFAWYKGIIQTNLIDFGFDGWMADFGEYLPPDAVFASGVSGEELHNQWPVLWARANREAVQEAGRLGDIVFWMRAGFSGSQNFSVMTWAGDQLVDFSTADGLASVIPAALSLGMSGFGLNHFDIGGYTSLYGVTRTEELLLRYADFAAFTPVMRSHEGNRPSENWQYYSSVHSMKMLARATDIFILMKNYTRSVLGEVSASGYPAQRPLFFHYDNDPLSFDDSMKYQYLLGRDLLVAPVYLPSSETNDRWSVYLPPDDWVYLWNGTVYSDGGYFVTVDAPPGVTPAFYRKDSPSSEFFKGVTIQLMESLALERNMCVP